MKTTKTNNRSTTPPQQPPTRERNSSHNPPAPKSIHITINMGAIHTLIASVRRRLFAKRTAIIIGVLLVFITGYFIFDSVRHKQSSKNDAATAANQVVENLEYQTVLPANKPIDKLGGWRQISPPGSEPVYAYSDTLSDVAITVSQQPLPQSFKSNVDNHVADMAKKFSAATTLDADGTKVYIGTSAKGPQSVIFTKNGLLILVKSQQKINDTTWVSYIKSLD